MSVFISSLNSGSNGNCYYVGNNEGAILIDAGISCKEIEKRMDRLNLSMNKVKALFISHEHTDHIKGLPTLSKKYNIPIYITSETLGRCNFIINPTLIHSFDQENPISVGEFKVTAFAKTHDAIHPHSFVIENSGLKIGVFTDIGRVCSELINHFKQCDAAFLESNYCENLLENGNYPYFLKNRIRGGKGHLSNKEALNLFINHRSANLSLLILSHLSQHNNCQDLVRDLFTEKAKQTKIIVASRLKETELFEVNSAVAVKKQPVYQQASLF